MIEISSQYIPLSEFTGYVGSYCVQYDPLPGIKQKDIKAFFKSLLHKHITTQEEREEIARQAARLFAEGYQIGFTKKTKKRKPSSTTTSSKQHLPATYKASRQAVLQIDREKNDIFSSLEAKGARFYLWQGIPRQITTTDFLAFQLAAAQTLYNQSYEAGNAELNCGISKVQDNVFSEVAGEISYYGTIEVSLRDFCRAGYGSPDPSPRQMEAMKQTISALHNTFIRIEFPNGNSNSFPLLSINHISEKAKGKATVYGLRLNPIFTMIRSQFIELPQNATQLIEAAAIKATDSHFSLLLHIARQKSEIFTRYVDKIAEILQISSSEFVKNRKRAERRILTVCSEIQKTGIITTFKVFPEGYAAGQGDSRRLEKIEFMKNSDFLRPHSPKK